MMRGMDILHDEPQQLSLLPAPEVPVRFRLDEATRRRGLQHIAEIRARLAARESARTTTDTTDATDTRRAA
jgi:hypothetical protein